MSELLRLSDYDFELLARDLLSAEFGVRFESFARGRDEGIDLRYSTPPRNLFASPNPDIIVQCKHYVRSGISKLKSKLKSEEKAKITRLSPKRYILVTSLDLTAANKSELRAILAPFVLSDSDVYGASDIGALLARHPQVERVHFKLWLTSTAVLDRVLHSEIYHQTEHVLRNLEANAIRYVQNQSYPAARDMLANNHVCIIAGRAGIGKTTLAEMLLLEHISRGYQAVVVSQDAGEANRLWNADPTIPQIFYYDDFLGQAATADKLNKNEDDRLGALLNRVTTTKNKRLILTTREYILEQAKQDYERLQRMNLDAHKHIIRLDDYTRLHKAQILYNHLYFSNLDANVRASIVPQRVYKSIISHPNYTPRIIDDISRRAGMDGIGADKFPAYFLAILDDPKTLWQHTFDRSISAEARVLLLALASLPTMTTLGALRVVYDSLQTEASSKPFFYALKEVDGDFLTTTQDENLTIVAFFNPSVRDFVLARLLESAQVRERLLTVIPYFEQALALHAQAPHLFGGPALCRALIRTFDSGGCVVIAHGEPTFRIYELSVTSPAFRLLSVLQSENPNEVSAAWLHDAVVSLTDRWTKGALGNRTDIAPLIDALRSRDPLHASKLVEAVRIGLREGEMRGIEDAEFARDFINAYGEALTNEDRKAVGAAAETLVALEIENLFDLKDPEEIRTQLEHMQSLADDFGNAIDDYDVQRIEEHISELEDKYSNAADWDNDRSGGYSMPDSGDDTAIDDLFDSLV